MRKKTRKKKTKNFFIEKMVGDINEMKWENITQEARLRRETNEIKINKCDEADTTEETWRKLSRQQMKHKTRKQERDDKPRVEDETIKNREAVQNLTPQTLKQTDAQKRQRLSWSLHQTHSMPLPLLMFVVFHCDINTNVHTHNHLLITGKWKC